MSEQTGLNIIACGCNIFSLNNCFVVAPHVFSNMCNCPLLEVSCSHVWNLLAYDICLFPFSLSVSAGEREWLSDV